MADMAKLLLGGGGRLTRFYNLVPRAFRMKSPKDLSSSGASHAEGPGDEVEDFTESVVLWVNKDGGRTQRSSPTFRRFPAWR